MQMARLVIEALTSNAGLQNRTRAFPTVMQGEMCQDFTLEAETGKRVPNSTKASWNYAAKLLLGDRTRRTHLFISLRQFSTYSGVL